MTKKVFIKPNSLLYWDTSINERESNREVEILYQDTASDKTLVKVIANGDVRLVKNTTLTTSREKVAKIIAARDNFTFREISYKDQVLPDEVLVILYEVKL